MKAMKTILALMVTLLALTACNKEDDIDEIFVGRTWFMTGIAYNGANNSSETRNFYTDTDRNCYFITFSSNTFQGKLSSGVTISGTWQANGKHQTITLNLQQKPSLDNLFDKQLLNILSNVQSYKSGADFLQLKDNNQNTIQFGNNR